MLACLALLLGFIYAGPAAAHSPTVVIEMTSEGFVPREVTVDTETIINFVNKDTVDRWPASNVHPTHDLYPEFDPQHPIPPGDLWIFRPKRAGEFKYHDHLLPHKRGTLTVIPEESPSPSTSPAEQSSPSFLRRLLLRLNAFFERVFKTGRELLERGTPPLEAAAFAGLSETEQHAYLASLKEEQGPAAAWSYVKSAYTDTSGAALGGRAHDLAHFTGEMIFQDRGLNGLALCDATFAFGCYHGFTEAAFAESLDPLLDIARSCETVGAPGSGPWASCIHGIGHGVATFFDAVELANALATCDRLGPGALYCHDGVFMEFSFSAPPSFYSGADPLAPCTTVAEQYRPACARNQPSVLQHRLGLSREAAAAACSEAASNIAESCIDAIGFAIAQESQGDPEIIIARCREIKNPPLEARCVSAAAGELVFQNIPNWQAGSAVACDSLLPDFRTA
jgi:hypothetical protein